MCTVAPFASGRCAPESVDGSSNWVDSVTKFSLVLLWYGVEAPPPLALWLGSYGQSR